MEAKKFFSVSQISRIAGVSIRTLHHYDSIGLLTPVRRQDNGYREYTEQQLARLHQILLYRNLHFSLDDIKSIVNANDVDAYDALAKQRSLLLSRLDETQAILQNIEVAMNVIQGEKNLDILFSALPKAKAEQWKSLFVDKEHENGAYDETFKSLGNLTEQESGQLQQAFVLWVTQYKQVLPLPVHADAVQELVLQHLQLQNRFLGHMFKDGDYKGIGYQGYLNLATGIIADPLSTEMYAYYAAGMPEHLHEAMMYFAEFTFKDNIDTYRSMGIEPISPK